MRSVSELLMAANGCLIRTDRVAAMKYFEEAERMLPKDDFEVEECRRVLEANTNVTFTIKRCQDTLLHLAGRVKWAEEHDWDGVDCVWRRRER